MLTLNNKSVKLKENILLILGLPLTDFGIYLKNYSVSQKLTNKNTASKISMVQGATERSIIIAITLAYRVANKDVRKLTKATGTVAKNSFFKMKLGWPYGTNERMEGRLKHYFNVEYDKMLHEIKHDHNTKWQKDPKQFKNDCT